MSKGHTATAGTPTLCIIDDALDRYSLPRIGNFFTRQARGHSTSTLSGRHTKLLDPTGPLPTASDDRETFAEAVVCAASENNAAPAAYGVLWFPELQQPEPMSIERGTTVQQTHLAAFVADVGATESGDRVQPSEAKKKVLQTAPSSRRTYSPPLHHHVEGSKVPTHFLLAAGLVTRFAHTMDFPCC